MYRHQSIATIPAAHRRVTGHRISLRSPCEERANCRFSPHDLRSGANMAVEDSPLTRASLLVQLRSTSNQAAWQEFAAMYGPIVYGFARKRGLQDADAADLMQDVMRSISVAAKNLQYDPRKGSFRGWLFTVTRNRIFNFLSKRKNQS